jgi:hypothetical protein
LYEILGDDKNNVFKNLTKKEWADSRKVVITSILATDMMHHFKMVEEVDNFYEIQGSQLEDPIKKKELFKDTKNVEKLLSWLMHACDIANSAKPWKTCQAWATAVTEEFFQQGDKEKLTGLPVSPMMDRASTAIPQMQCGFIEFVVAPLFANLIKILPEIHYLGYNLCNNRRIWGHKVIKAEDKLSAKRNEERQKMAKRVESLDAKFSNSKPILNALQETDKFQTANVQLKIEATFAGNKAAGCKLFSNGDEISFDGVSRDPGALTKGGGIVTTTLRLDDLLVVELWDAKLVGKVGLDYDDIMELVKNKPTKMSVEDGNDSGSDKVVSLFSEASLTVTLLGNTNLLNQEMQESFHNRQHRSGGARLNINLSIQVLGAQIYDKEMKHCDPFCKLFWDGMQFGQTLPIRQSLEPIWTSHNDFSMSAQPQPDSSLRVELWNRDYYAQDTLLGQMKLDMSIQGLMSLTGKEDEHKLWGIAESAEPVGVMKLSVRRSKGKV